MGTERLCPSCRREGIKCWFRDIAEETAESPDYTTFEKQVMITEQRVMARERECPDLNEIDPYYEGKEKL